jgi:hypothetical protein
MSTTTTTTTTTDLPEVDESGRYFKTDIPIETVAQMTHAEWMRITRDRTVWSNNLLSGPRRIFCETVDTFTDAWRTVAAELNGEPAPTDVPHWSLPPDDQRHELEENPAYIPAMTDRLGPRIFDTAYLNTESDARDAVTTHMIPDLASIVGTYVPTAVPYATVLGRAKLYAERATHAQWNGGHEMASCYIGETGSRIEPYTEIYIRAFVAYVALATSHALLSPERKKQAERDAALAFRHLDTITLPISDELRAILLDPHLRLTRGRDTDETESAARTAFIHSLASEELRAAVRALFKQVADARAAADARHKEAMARHKRCRDADETDAKTKQKTEHATTT